MDTQGVKAMIGDAQALERIHHAIRHYLSHDITEGECLGDVVDALEAGGRAVFGQVSSDDRPAAESRPRSRSWAPRDGSDATEPLGAAEPRREGLRSRPEARA